MGSEAYPAVIYDSWDPNWRGFLGTTFVVMLEEYADCLSEETKELMVESLYHATVGDTYRVGGVDNDNLYPAYSNPVSSHSMCLTFWRHISISTNMLITSRQSCEPSSRAGWAAASQTTT